MESIKRLQKAYDNTNSDASALELVLALYPEWEETKSYIRFIRFTDGITNTLLKAENRRPGLSDHEINQEAILLRAYGRGTHVLIDRERECLSHSLCASHDLAPALLARFDNGLMYRFIEGNVTQPIDMRRPEVSRGIARRLGEWHARVPIDSLTTTVKDEYDKLTPDMPTPNLWTVMNKWVAALPTDTDIEVKRKAQLTVELPWMVKQFGQLHDKSQNSAGFVFAHCDLLSGNVIMLPSGGSGDYSSSGSPATPASATSASLNGSPDVKVDFIDYEYATPAPAAFDIANHFAEWGGFDCDFTTLPTRQQRREFLHAYLDSYHSYHGPNRKIDGDDEQDHDKNLERFMHEVDAFRGIPGFYWGVWALIQATISHIEFDYASYAQVRLGEYWAWKRTVVSDPNSVYHSKEVETAERVREKRWAQEV